MTRILALFNISKPVNEHGDHIEPKIDWTSSVISYVLQQQFFATYKLMITNMISFHRHLQQFDCQIKPRSEEHLSLLEQQLEA